MSDVLDIEALWNGRIFPGYYMSDLDDALACELWGVLAYSPAHHAPHPDAEKPGSPIAEAIKAAQDAFPWQAACELLARYWHRAAARLASMPPTVYAGLDSPREYNFASDRVRFLMRPRYWRAFVARARTNCPLTIDAVLRDALTPRPGCVPRFSARLAEWHSDPTRWAPAQCGLIVEAVAAVAACQIWNEADALTAAAYERGDRPQQAFAADVYDELHTQAAFSDAVNKVISHTIKHDEAFCDTWNHLARLTGRDAT